MYANLHKNLRTRHAFDNKMLQGESESGFSRLEIKDLSIAIRGLPVVHLQVYARTLPSERTYTYKCTHVHCQVYDGMSAVKDWGKQGLTLTKPRIDIDKNLTKH